MGKTNLILFGIAILLTMAVLATGSYNNRVIFTGDEWDYQSIAVNDQYRHGFMTTGPIENKDVYLLDSLDEGKIRFWENFAGRKAFYRVPFYPAFLSLTYKLFGISPIVVKYFQLLLILLAGLLLVVIGKLAFGDKGFKIGLVAFIVFVFLNRRFSEHLMPESWQLLFLSLLTICLFHYYRGSRLWSIWFGLILGLSILNKGTTFFLFPLILIFDLASGRLNSKKHIGNLLVFLTGIIFVTGSWSLYLSIKTNQLTYISTQPGDVILDGNNELCNDGLWHPEWRENASSFYNVSMHDGKSEIVRISEFYINNPKYISNFFSKIKAGFSPVHSYLAFAFVFLNLISILIFRKWIMTSIFRYKFIFIILLSVLNISALIIAFFSQHLNSFLFSFFFLSIISTAVYFRRIFNEFSIVFPVPFVIVFLNFFLFTLVFYVCNETYPSRYVKTMDGIFLLMCIYLFYKSIRIFFLNRYQDEKLESRTRRTT